MEINMWSVHENGPKGETLEQNATMIKEVWGVSTSQRGLLALRSFVG
jgi:hypothetical protein